MPLSPGDKKEIVKSINQKLALRSDMEMVVTKDRQRGILSWGKKNDFPGYLISLVKGQPQHAGIVQGKAKYLTGIKIKGSTPTGDEWLKRANPKESWQQIRTKYNKDYTLFGGRAIKIVPNALGTPLWYFHMDFGKHRISECRTRVQFSTDWSKRWDETIESFPIWYPGCKETAIYLYRNYNQTVKEIESAYPTQEYESGIKSIDTLKRIQNYKNSLVANNFSSGTIVTIFSGKPETQAEEEAVADRLKGEHTGDEKAGNIVVLFGDQGDKPADVQQIQPNDLDKQFEGVTQSETVNVFAAHNAPADLFNYISDASKVFDVNKIVEQNELFMNSYVVPTQEPEMEMIKSFYKLRTGQEETFEIEQFNPIGLDLPLENQAVVTALNGRDPNIIINWLDKKYKLNIPKIQNGLPSTPVAQGQVNEHLKNLTGKQTQGIMRIVRKYLNAEYSELQATMLLKSGFGLTDMEAREFLGIESGQVPIQQRVAFSRENHFFALFDKYAHDVVEDEVLEVNFIDYKVEFVAVKFSTEAETRTAILTKIKDDPSLSNEQIADTLGVTLKVVEAAMAWLIAKKLVEKVGDVFTVTKKGQEAKRAVIYTEYNYDLRPDLKAKGQPLFIATSRQWCRDFYAKFGVGKKALTFEAIDAMSNEFGDDVWSYRGGWYGNEPWCRHGFVGTTKIRYE